MHTAIDASTRLRRGIATVWVIAAVPAFLVLLVLVTDIANLWLARVELGNAVEAGALAAAKVWGDGPDNAATRTSAHTAAKNFVEANTVVGNSLSANANNNPAATNNNANCPGDVLLGRYDSSSATFSAATPPTTRSKRASRVRAAVTVNSLWTGFLGPFTLEASATARFDEASGTPKLVQIAAGDDPCTAP